MVHISNIFFIFMYVLVNTRERFSVQGFDFVTHFKDSVSMKNSDSISCLMERKLRQNEIILKCYKVQLYGFIYYVL